MFCLLLCCPFLILRGMEMLSVNNYLMTFYYFLMFERATSSAVRQRNNPHPRCSIWMMRVSYITGIMLFLSLKLNSRECVCVHVCVCLHVCGCALSHNHAQSCLTLCDPMDCSPQASLSLGILQARILEWVVMLSSNEYIIVLNYSILLSV